MHRCRFHFIDHLQVPIGVCGLGAALLCNRHNTVNDVVRQQHPYTLLLPFHSTWLRTHTARLYYPCSTLLVCWSAMCLHLQQAWHGHR